MGLSTQIRTLLIKTAPLIFAAGLAHLGYQIWKHWDVVAVDFRFFWLAGEFWTRGESPYGPAYAEAAAAQFSIFKGAVWYYAPNWFAIAGFLSLFDPLWGSRLWSIANAILLLAASVMNVAAFAGMKGRAAFVRLNTPLADLLRSIPPARLIALHAGFMALTQAAGNTLHLGQSSMLVYFGASLLLLAATEKRTAAGAVGFALVMLKPQIGLLVCAALAFSAYGRRVAAAGGLLSFLLAVPAFVLTPAPEVIANLAAGIAQYADQAYNLPAAMTGLRHLAWAIGGVDMGGVFYLLLAVIAICAVGIAGRRRAPRPRTVDMMMIAVAAALFLAPLHVYDFTLMGVMLFYCACLRAPFRAVAAAAFLLAWRAGNLPQPQMLQAPDITYYVGSLYATLGAGAVLTALLWSFAPSNWINPKRPTAPAAASQAS